jgi:hypothetical protein
MRWNRLDVNRHYEPGNVRLGDCFGTAERQQQREERREAKQRAREQAAQAKAQLQQDAAPEPEPSDDPAPTNPRAATIAASSSSSNSASRDHTSLTTPARATAGRPAASAAFSIAWFWCLRKASLQHLAARPQGGDFGAHGVQRIQHSGHGLVGGLAKLDDLTAQRVELGADQVRRRYLISLLLLDLAPLRIGCPTFQIGDLKLAPFPQHPGRPRRRHGDCCLIAGGVTLERRSRQPRLGQAAFPAVRVGLKAARRARKRASRRMASRRASVYFTIAHPL